MVGQLPAPVRLAEGDAAGGEKALGDEKVAPVRVPADRDDLLVLEEEERLAPAGEDANLRLALQPERRVVRDRTSGEEGDDLDRPRQSDSSSVQRSFSSVFFTMPRNVSPSAPSMRRWSNVTPR